MQERLFFINMYKVIYKSQISSNNHSKRIELNNSAWLAANFTPGDGWDGLFAGSGCTGTAPLIAWSLVLQAYHSSLTKRPRPSLKADPPRSSRLS